MKTRTALILCITLNAFATVSFAQDAACRADAQKFCAKSNGDSETFDCLLNHQQDVTDACYASLKKQLKSAPESTPAPAPATSSRAHGAQSGGICGRCGEVTSVNVVENDGAKVAGLVGGALLGGLLGHQVGQGKGNTAATLVGAAGGAYAGNAAVNSQTKTWQVKVHFNSGPDQTFTFNKDPGFEAGDSVKRSDSTIVPN